MYVSVVHSDAQADRGREGEREREKGKVYSVFEVDTRISSKVYTKLTRVHVYPS